MIYWVSSLLLNAIFHNISHCLPSNAPIPYWKPRGFALRTLHISCNIVAGIYLDIHAWIDRRLPRLPPPPPFVEALFTGQASIDVPTLSRKFIG